MVTNRYQALTLAGLCYSKILRHVQQGSVCAVGCVKQAAHCHTHLKYFKPFCLHSQCVFCLCFFLCHREVALSIKGLLQGLNHWYSKAAAEAAATLEVYFLMNSACSLLPLPTTSHTVWDKCSLLLQMHLWCEVNRLRVIYRQRVMNQNKRREKESVMTAVTVAVFDESLHFYKVEKKEGRRRRRFKITNYCSVLEGMSATEH